MGGGVSDFNGFVSKLLFLKLAQTRCSGSGPCATSLIVRAHG